MISNLNALPQIDLTPIKDLWQSNKKDFFSWIGSFIICLVYSVEKGLLFGIVVSMICILLRLGNPKIEVTLKQVCILPIGSSILHNKLRGINHAFPIVLTSVELFNLTLILP